MLLKATSLSNQVFILQEELRDDGSVDYEFSKT